MTLYVTDKLPMCDPHKGSQRASGQPYTHTHTHTYTHTAWPPPTSPHSHILAHTDNRSHNRAQFPWWLCSSLWDFPGGVRNRRHSTVCLGSLLWSKWADHPKGRTIPDPLHTHTRTHTQTHTRIRGLTHTHTYLHFYTCWDLGAVSSSGARWNVNALLS